MGAGLCPRRTDAGLACHHRLPARARGWWQTRDELWIAGAIVLVANWPYTMLMIMPVNNALKAISLDEAGEESHALLQRWGRLHARRTMLGVLATLLMLWAVVGPAHH